MCHVTDRSHDTRRSSDLGVSFDRGTYLPHGYIHQKSQRLRSIIYPFQDRASLLIIAMMFHLHTLGRAYLLDRVVDWDQF